MAESVFEKLAGRVAVNKQSAQSAFGSGTHYAPTIKYNGYHSDVPPTMKPPPPDGPDFRGRAFGRFVVIGLMDAPRRNKGARWVVRCKCGMYETRVTKAICNPVNNTVDRCADCRNLENLKQLSRRATLGDKRADAIRDELRAKGETI
jgi:hypothetical protein